MNTKLTSKVTNGIGWITAWYLIYPTMGVYGIVTNLINKVTEHKDDANTRGTSVESKIHPKNTKKVRNDFGYPTREI